MTESLFLIGRLVCIIVLVAIGVVAWLSVMFIRVWKNIK